MGRERDVKDKYPRPSPGGDNSGEEESDDGDEEHGEEDEEDGDEVQDEWSH